jgi:hypothetical protein
MTAGRELEGEEAGAAAGIERVEHASAREDEIEDAIPGGALRRRADAVAKVVVEARRPPIPVGGDLLLDDLSSVGRHTMSLEKMVGRDGIEPPTPGFSDLSYGDDGVGKVASVLPPSPPTGIITWLDLRTWSGVLLFVKLKFPSWP